LGRYVSAKGKRIKEQKDIVDNNSRCPFPSSNYTSCCAKGGRIDGRRRLVIFECLRSSPLISLVESSGTTSQASAPAATQPKAHAGRASRGPRRAGAQPVRLEALDDSLGPLGPLGDNAPTPQADQPPAPPQKEQTVTHNIRQPVASSQSSATRTLLDSVDLGDEAEPTPGPRIPPPVQPSPGGPIRRDNNPSVSIEQAAKPTFDITVGDPHKVGDLTSSHIVYSVQTRVRALEIQEKCINILTAG
jgi:hypothetical protein